MHISSIETGCNRCGLKVTAKFAWSNPRPLDTVTASVFASDKTLVSSVSSGRREGIDVCVPLGIALVEMFEDSRTFLFVEVSRVGARQPSIEQVLDSVLDARAAWRFRQSSTSNSFRRSSSCFATFFTSACSSVLNSGAGRVRMSKTTSSSSVMCSRTWRSCSSVRVRLNVTRLLNSSSMFRLPAL